MEHFDVFSMVKKQDCNKLVCVTKVNGEEYEKQVKTCCDIKKLLDLLSEEAKVEDTFRMVWYYTSGRVVTSECRLQDVMVDAAQIVLQNVSVELRQFKEVKEATNLPKLVLSAATLRRPIPRIRPSAA